jgi:hypothetical protein
MRSARPRGIEFLALVSALAFAAAAGRAAEPATDADLAIASGAVADEANGFLRLEEAARAIRLLPEERARLAALAPGPPDPAQDLRIAEANESALALLEAAIRAPGFASGRIRELGPEIDAWKTLARISAVRAAVRARAGNAQGAVADAMAPVELGRRIAADPHCPLWCAIVAFGLKRIGTTALAAALPHLSPTPDESRALAAALARDATDHAAWRGTWAVEYQRMKQLGGKMSDDEAEDLDAAAVQFRAIRSRIGRPCSDWLAPTGDRKAAMLRLGSFDFGSFEVRRCLSDTDIAAAETLVALRAYAVEHGDALPAALDALVPRYIDAVPRDAFDGAPLRYAPERRLLMSVGSDLVVGRDPRKTAAPYLADPVFPIAF